MAEIEKKQGPCGVTGLAVAVKFRDYEIVVVANSTEALKAVWNTLSLEGEMSYDIVKDVLVIEDKELENTGSEET